MLRFGEFELCEEARELRRDGAALALQPKVFDLLRYLVHHRHRVVADAELIGALWPDAVVTASSLSRALKALRQVLGDDGRQQRLVRTFRGRGYRFVAAVEETVAVSGADPYVGRPALLAALDRALADAGGGEGSLQLLIGPAGIGKTRTAIELARRARARGVRVAWAHCDAGAGAPPLAPWWRLLRALDGASSDPIDVAGTPDGARFGLFTRIAERLEGAVAGSRALLVIDDLHEADAGSVALLAFLAPELSRLPLVLCATLRNEEVERIPELGRRLSQLGRRAGVARHELAGLDAAEIAHFVALRAGREPPRVAVDALHAATSGNPFFLDELVRGGLRESGTDPLWSELVPRGLEHVLRARLARLTDPTRDVLRAAAVLGERFDDELLARVAECEVDDALGEARSEQLVEEAPRDAGRHRFAHALFREALLAELSAAARAALHARAARALEERIGERRAGAEDVAAHWLAAGARGEPARAVEWARRAGLRALAAQGWEQAEELLRSATDLCTDGVAPPATECELWIRLAEARQHLGDRSGAEAAGAQAAALAHRHGWPARRAEAVLAQVGPLLQYRLPDPSVSSLLRGALEGLAPEDAPLAARLAARRAAEHVLDPDHAAAAALRRSAVDAALSCGDAEVLAEVLMTPYSGIWEHVEPSRRLALADACIERARTQGNPIAEGRGRVLRLAELLGLGAFDRFDEEVDAAETMTAECREPIGRYQVLLHRATRALAAGAFERAEQFAAGALALGRRLELPGAFELFVVQLTLIRREQGRLLETAANESLFLRHPSASARALFAWGFAEVGEEAKARRLLAEALECDIPSIGAQPTGVANAAVLARTCRLLAVREPAAALVPVLEPHRARVVLRGTLGAHGPGAWFLAMLAGLAGRSGEVRPLLEEALALCKQAGAAAWQAEIDHDIAAWLAEAGDVAAARPFAARAARAAAALGQRGLRPRAEELAKRLRAD